MPAAGEETYMLKLFYTLLIIIAPPMVTAHEYAQKNITVDHPWSKPTPPLSEYGVAYFNVSNSGQKDDLLLEIKIPDEIAKSASIHDVIHDGEMMRMREVTNGKKIPAGGTIKFQPGGSHIMLEGLPKPLKLEDKFTIELVFTNAGNVPVEIWVEDAPQQSDKHHNH